LIRIKNIIH